MSRKRRIVGKIDKLKPSLKDTVDQMLISGDSYNDIVRYVIENGEKISVSCVHRYAKRFLASVEQIRIAQENQRMIMSEMEKYPNLDPMEAILRLSAQKVMDAVVSMKDEQWDNVSADKLMSQVTGLARAIAYKKGIDSKTKDDEEIALEAQQNLLYDVLKKENPKLYGELQAEISRLRQKIRDGG